MVREGCRGPFVCTAAHLDESEDTLPVGVNAIASWASTTGLAEAARRCVLAMVDAGVEVAIEDYDYGAPRDDRRIPPSFGELPSGRRHAIDLYFLNVNELHVVDDDYLHRGDHYVIGSWFWELPRLARHDLPELGRVDEIWTATNFVAGAFRGRTDRPVTVLPCVVEPRPDPALRRAHFGLPEEGFCFLFHFDASFAIERKNPRGAIDAFRQAFSRAERERDVRLVIKTSHLAEHPAAAAALRDELELVNGVLIDAELSDAEMASLIDCCDGYLSLHRAEGFGLGMAEAMYLAKPVVATGYSANTEFMGAWNSCPVAYRMRAIDRVDLRLNPGSESVYVPGELWADPDLYDAAQWLRRVYDRPAFRASIAREGQRTVQSRFGRATVGREIRARLEQLPRSPIGASAIR